MTIKQNRDLFLTALRSGEFEKGAYIAGQSAPPEGATGFCAIGLPAYLFGIYTGMHAKLWETLGLTPFDISHIQNQWNDSTLTFPQIADLIEHFMFAEKRPSWIM